MDLIAILNGVVFLITLVVSGLTGMFIMQFIKQITRMIGSGLYDMALSVFFGLIAFSIMQACVLYIVG